VKPEDLRADAMGSPSQVTDFVDEEEGGEFEGSAPGVAVENHDSIGFLKGVGSEQQVLPFEGDARSVGSPTYQ
ncbi:hypothetical protein ACXYUI_33885, partial [Klebsiella pneumoniae]